MIKLFASDLDGTLLNAFHEVDRTIVACAREVINGGDHLALATGRALRHGREIGFEDIPVDIVGSNGAIIRDGDGRLLRSFPIDPAFVEETLRAFPTICFDCVAPEGMYIRGSREQRAATFMRDGLIRRIAMHRARRRAQGNPTHHFDQTLGQILNREVCKINCRIPDEGLAREFAGYLADREDRVVNAPFSPVVFEISDRSVNKGASVAWLARYYGIEEDEVAVYGDGGNDLVMLERFEHSYATSNGSEEAKRAAGAVIGPCWLHAVPRHIRSTLRRTR